MNKNNDISIKLIMFTGKVINFTLWIFFYFALVG